MATWKKVAYESYVDDEIRDATQYSYDHIVCNYNTSSAAIAYVPLGGFIYDQTSISSVNKEYTALIAPHDGTFHKFFWRPTTAQTSGTAWLKMYIGGDGTTYAAVLNFQARLSSWSLTANYTYAHEVGVDAAFMTGPLGGNISNEFTAGDIISIGFDPNVAPGDVNCTVVLKYDMTT